MAIIIRIIYSLLTIDIIWILKRTPSIDGFRMTAILGCSILIAYIGEKIIKKYFSKNLES